MTNTMIGKGVAVAADMKTDPDQAATILDQLERQINDNPQARLLFMDIEAVWAQVCENHPHLLDRTVNILAGVADPKVPMFRILKTMERHNSPQAVDALLRFVPGIPAFVETDCLIEAGVAHYMLGKPWLLERLLETGLAHEICQKANTNIMRVVVEELLNGRFPLDVETGVTMVDYLIGHGVPTEVTVPGLTPSMEVRAYKTPLDKVVDLLERQDHDRAGDTLDILAGGGFPLGEWERDDGIVGEHLAASVPLRRRRLGQMARPSAITRPRSKM